MFETFSFQDDGNPSRDLLEGMPPITRQRRRAPSAPPEDDADAATHPGHSSLRGDQFAIHDEDEE